MMNSGYYHNQGYRSDWFYRRCVGWELSFVWLPKRCNLTGRRIWLEWAYQGTGVLIGPGDSIFENRWHSKDEHLIFLLKGN